MEEGTAYEGPGALAVTKVIVVAIAVASVAAYAVLWLGGALELQFPEEGMGDGPECWEMLAAGSSTAARGTEGERWLGGGILGRPGRVCVVTPEDAAVFSPEELGPELTAAFARGDVAFPILSDLDIASGLAAPVTFLVVAVIGCVVGERRGRARRGAPGSSPADMRRRDVGTVT